jgi:hypothetical protein
MTSYRVHGTTNDTDMCEHCGKEELRRVVMLMVLDADGNGTEVIHVGTTCASRLLAKRGVHTTAAKVRDAAAAAERVMAQAREFAAEFATVSFNQYVAVNHVGLMVAAGNDMQAALPLARKRYSDLQAEIATVNAGSVTGTRFEAMLPKL